ncbi:solute carrier family 26 member 6-like protein [Corchorus olitorius]|uniref:Solute carrier family 26 member 6-like protein n=1 Tax=Corchorus olitorius TaxID=93759 RepID=A0A1R3H9U1_9ROSI|nr:solute carrier family 26 member 6-like protein [Corchorus olitorius]
MAVFNLFRERVEVLNCWRWSEVLDAVLVLVSDNICWWRSVELLMFSSSTTALFFTMFRSAPYLSRKMFVPKVELGAKLEEKKEARQERSDVVQRRPRLAQVRAQAT